MSQELEPVTSDSQTTETRSIQSESNTGAAMQLAGNARELPEGYSVRAATMEDVLAALELFNACEIAEHGEPDYEEDEVRDEWSELDLENDVMLIEGVSGNLVGSLTPARKQEGLYEAFIYVHPDHTGKGLGSWLIEASELKARRQLDAESPGGTITVRNFVAGINEPANRLLQAHGYDAVRRFWRMQIELTEEPAPVSWPDGYELRDFVAGRDEPGFFAVLDESFGDHWGGTKRSYDEWLRRLKSGNASSDLWLQFFNGEERVAIATAKPSDGFGWISHVGVLKPHRRRGLGEAMLLTLFRRFWDRGIRQIALGVDTENSTGAVSLYERAGMHVNRSHIAYEKVLSTA
jgi:mycothiol synthase